MKVIIFEVKEVKTEHIYLEKMNIRQFNEFVKQYHSKYIFQIMDIVNEY